MSDQLNIKTPGADDDTEVIRIPAQRNGRGYPGTLAGTAAGHNTGPRHAVPAELLRDRIGL